MIDSPEDDPPGQPTLSSPEQSPTTSPKGPLKSALKSRSTSPAPRSPKSPLKSALRSPSPSPRATPSASPRMARLRGDDEDEGGEEGLGGDLPRIASGVRIGQSFEIALDDDGEEGEEGGGEEDGDVDSGHLSPGSDNVRHRRKSLAIHLKEASQKFQASVHPKYEDRSYNQMFIELDELKLGQSARYEWHEKARWIKYEENLQPGSQRWSKPHVASMSFHSLIQLRSLLDSGLVILDAEVEEMEDLAEEIARGLVEGEMMEEKHRRQLIDTLVLPHRHQHVSQFSRRGSIFPQIARTPSPISRSPYNAKKLKEINQDYFEKNGKESSPAKDAPQVKLLSPYDAEDPERGRTDRRRSSTALGTDITRRLAEEAEAFAVMVGEVPFLETPVCAFVRLDETRTFPGLLEIPLPVRFLFVLLGPRGEEYDYYQIGRSMATVMSSLDFQQLAFEAMNHKRLVYGINAFLTDSLVLPPGEWHEDTLLPIIAVAKQKAGEVRRKSLHPLAMERAIRQMSVEENPLQRTGRVFGGMVNDVKRRFPLYLSDLRDGLNVQCLATFFFIYFACLAPAITFGGLMSSKVNRWIGVPEMLLATSVVGILFALFSAQPLKIIGVTGPMLLFEESLYQICEAVGLEYISTRVWVGVWIAVITVVVVAVDGSVLVRLISRFTEEIFSALISLLFIYETFFKLYKIFYNHPLIEYYPRPEPPPFLNSTDDLSLNATSSVNTTESPITTIDKITNQPNTALLSLFLTLGTFGIAFFLKYFRNSKYLGRTARRALGDFGIPLAIFIMVLVDFLIRDTYTEKLDVPDGLQPTAAEKRGWLINPMGMETPLPIWAIFAAIIPALLGFILIFMESQISGVIVNKPDRQLKKGSGFHLDILLIGLFCIMNGFLGFPMMCAAAVRSISHVNALSVFSKTHAPGERPRLVHVHEQRVTSLCVHVMIGVSVLLGPVLRLVPLAVLFGVFLYMGVASMSGVQLFDRLEMMFMPTKHHSDEAYVQQVKTWRMHLFTIIQLFCLGILWAVKSTKAALAFPFVLIMMVPVRKLILPKIFTAKELNVLDSSGAQPNPDEKSEEAEDLDFYEEAQMSNIRQR